jgi:hypothetical protein
MISIRDFYRISLAQGARMKLETGAVVESAEGLSTEVVRRQLDGDWKFVIDNPRTPR